MVIALETDFKEIVGDKWSGFTWSRAGNSVGNTVINVGFVKCYRSDNQLMKNDYAPDSDLVLITRSLLDIHVTSPPLRVRISGYGVKSNCMVCARLRSACKCKNRTVRQRQRNSKGLWRKYN
jgi:hypothetical protein